MSFVSKISSFQEPARNKLVSWFSNFVSWQGATNAHSLSSVIEERRSQGAKGQSKWVSYFLPAPQGNPLSAGVENESK